MLPVPLPPESHLLNRRRVYHVSPAILQNSILEHGISPAFANGPKKTSFWVGKEALMWAIAHISAKKAISADQLIVYEANVWEGALACAKWKCCYSCAFIVAPDHVYSASNVLTWFAPNGEWLNG